MSAIPLKLYSVSLHDNYDLLTGDDNYKILKSLVDTASDITKIFTDRQLELGYKLSLKIGLQEISMEDAVRILARSAQLEWKNLMDYRSRH